MSIQVEIVVIGAVGDLVASMLAGMTVERRPPSTVLVAPEGGMLTLLDRLARSGVEVLSVAAVPTPGG